MGRDPLVYDPDWDEDARLGDWRAVVEQTRTLPPTLAAAITAEAWDAIAPLQHTPWLGRLLAAALLHQRGKTRWHLPCLHAGLKAIPRERRRAPRDAAAQLVVQLEALTAAAAAGLKDHDRWLNQRTLLARKLAGRRATSKLPALLDYVLTRPIVSAGMIAEELGITARAAQNLVAELGLRERPPGGGGMLIMTMLIMIIMIVADKEGATVMMISVTLPPSDQSRGRSPPRRREPPSPAQPGGRRHRIRFSQPGPPRC